MNSLFLHYDEFILSDNEAIEEFIRKNRNPYHRRNNFYIEKETSEVKNEKLYRVEKEL